MGGSSGQAGGSATPFAQQQGTANYAFGNVPFPGIDQSQSSAYTGIGQLNTNPAAQYGQAAGVGQNLTGAGGQLASQAGNAYSALSNAGGAYSNQFGALGTAATNTGDAYGSLFNTLGGQAGGTGQAAYNQGASTNSQLQPYVGQALQTGFDPQNALYAQQYQQNQDQVNAQNAMSGVATTPYGAALANQSGQNFNINWQNQELQRQQTAASTASQLAGAGNTALQGGTSSLQAGQNLAGSLYGQGANAQQTGQNLAGSLYGQGASALGNLSGQGASSASSLLGAGGTAASTGLGLGQSIDTQQYNAQQQQLQDYLQYVLGNTSNTSSYFGATNQNLSNALGQAGLNNTGAQQSNASTASSLSGLGSLLGSLGKLGLSL